MPRAHGEFRFRFTLRVLGSRSRRCRGSPPGTFGMRPTRRRLPRSSTIITALSSPRTGATARPVPPTGSDSKPGAAEKPLGPSMPATATSRARHSTRTSRTRVAATMLQIFTLTYYTQCWLRRIVSGIFFSRLPTGLLPHLASIRHLVLAVFTIGIEQSSWENGVIADDA